MDGKRGDDNKPDIPLGFTDYIPAIIASVMTVPCGCGVFSLVLVLLARSSATRGETKTARIHIKVSYIFSVAGVLIFILLVVLTEFKIIIRVAD